MRSRPRYVCVGDLTKKGIEAFGAGSLNYLTSNGVESRWQCVPAFKLTPSHRGCERISQSTASLDFGLGVNY
ncbi:hypothetical protein ACHAXA_000970 [Cyclostephanos tholiformis]|uniref:Uncharacterized protein n=1 Tax=Cyclostephanos tholiformis TaxID=382380 RepID=A0ABD3SE17_9STRA